MKRKIKYLISNCVPLSIKKVLFNSWNEYDTDFHLYYKANQYGGSDLFQKRFLWSDCTIPINSIRERFGPDQTINLLTDRTDYPKNKGFKILDINDIAKLSENEDHAVICAFESDEKLLQHLEVIKSKPNIYYFNPYRFVPAARYFDRNDLAKHILISDLNLKRGKFDLPDFENIIQCLDITKEIKGDYVEIGVFRGDSAHLAMHYMEKADINRKSYFFDLFVGFTNESSLESNDAVWANTHSDTSIKSVQQFLKGFEDCYIEKLDIVAQELPSQIKEIAVCNIDVDVYEAVKVAIIKVAPLMASGGIIIVEDSGHTPFLAGAYLATSEFIDSELAKDFIPVQLTSGQLILIRLRK